MKIFKEEQRFAQTWLILLLVISTIVPVVIITREYLQNELNLNQFIWTMLLIVFAATFIFFFKLKTRIDENGIHYQFIPFHFSQKKVSWSSIEKAYVRKYSPITEYGGWGLKGGFSKKNGKAINVSGDIGIQIELKSGKKLLIGTKKETDAKQVLKNYQYKIK